MFREVKEVPRQEATPMEKELEKIEIEIEGEESDSTKEVESEEEEPQTLFFRRSSRERRKLERYSHPYFSLIFIFLLLMMILEM